MNLTYKETGRLTINLFYKLYKHYKDDFDIEMRLKNSNTTYKELYSKSQKSEEWF